MSVPFRLYLISDRQRMGPDPAVAVAELARAGLEAFQWREKDLSPAENLGRLRAIAEAVTDALRAPASPTPSDASGGPGNREATVPSPSTAAFSLFVNDRIDLALLAGCHVHLTEESVPTDLARSLLPAGALIGRSTHSLEGARKAERAGADFVTFGPVYDTPSKRAYGPPTGAKLLRATCAAVNIPVFALGGVTISRVPECLAAGAWGVSVIREVWEAADRAAALRAFRAAFTS